MQQMLSLSGAIAGLVGLTVAVGLRSRVGQTRAVITAVLRAVVQLFAVGMVIGVIFRTPALAPVYVALVFVAATLTSAGRLRAAGLEAKWEVAAAIAAGVVASGVVVFASGALAWNVRTVIPFVVQLAGGSMTATTVAGQRMIDEVASSWGEVEAWLALGARPRQAVARAARLAAGRALVPALDQTRNVGLVVLPGAYVGLLLGGASPLEAGRVQLLVLVGLLAAETIAAAVVTRLISSRLGGLRPGVSGAGS